MGSPKKQRKKFSKPAHPWQKERILAEKELLKEYGLNRKYEIWKMSSILKNFTRQAKNLVSPENPQVEKERNQLLTKLLSLGLASKDSKIEDVLSLTLKDIMERRLQTLVYRKNMANTVKQARQLIVHEHISVGGKTITAPSHLVPLREENNINFSQNSAFSDPSHPGRAVAKEEKPKSPAKEAESSKKGSEKTKEKKSEKGAKEEANRKEEKREAKPKKAAKAQKEKPQLDKKSGEQVKDKKD
ncbi:30S ribosomal protein S4 [Candidatus Woesearchaeota archaeon]|nr:30S ribosomal protein S4 [Candidatus Woesearchaeota archaeon]